MLTPDAIKTMDKYEGENQLFLDVSVGSLWDGVRHPHQGRPTAWVGVAPHLSIKVTDS